MRDGLETIRFKQINNGGIKTQATLKKRPYLCIQRFQGTNLSRPSAVVLIIVHFKKNYKKKRKPIFLIFSNTL